jgi:hypothetical protein
VPSVGYELLYGQVTHAQGLFSPRTVNIHFSLELIRAGIITRTYSHRPEEADAAATPAKERTAPEPKALVNFELAPQVFYTQYKVFPRHGRPYMKPGRVRSGEVKMDGPAPIQFLSLLFRGDALEQLSHVVARDQRPIEDSLFSLHDHNGWSARL